jgi:hypothetical protein
VLIDITWISENMERWRDGLKNAPNGAKISEVTIRVGHQTVDMTLEEFCNAVGIEWPGE